jgi:hypothetical protein
MGKTFLQKEALQRVNKAKRLSTQQFIDKAKALHGEKFDYSITEYVNATTKIKIVCREHGEQEMLPHHHTHSKSYGCSVCGKQAINNKKQFTTEEFISKISDLKGLNFDKTVYKSKREKVIVTCLIHGDYETKAEILLKGHGCRKCSSVNSRGEKDIESWLEENNILFIPQKQFKNCIGERKRRLSFDFYIPEKNLCIEFDGKQHFKSIEYWGGEEGLKRRQQSDKIKTEFCQKNNINLLRVSYSENIREKLLSSLI